MSPATASSAPASSPRSTRPRRRSALAAAVVGLAALCVPAVAWAPPSPPDQPPPGAGQQRDDVESWPVCAVGFFNSETVGREHTGIAGGMTVSVLWQNQSYVTFLPVTLNSDGHETRHVLRPRQTVRVQGVAHFVFGDYRKYPEFGWHVSAETPSDAVLLSYAVSARRCRGSND